MDRKTVLAIALCFLIFFAWQKFYIEPRSNQKLPAEVSQATKPGSMDHQAGAQADLNSKTPVVPQFSGRPVATEAMQTGFGEVIFGNGAKVFENWTLNQYKKTLVTEATKMSLRDVTHASGSLEFLVDHPDYKYLSDVRGELKKIARGVRWEYEDSLLEMSREMVPSSEGAVVDVRVVARFKGVAPKYFFASVTGDRGAQDEDSKDRQILYFAQQDIQRVSLADEIELTAVSTPVKWLGVTSRYFLFALIPNQEMPGTALLQQETPTTGRGSLVFPVQDGRADFSFRVFFGPKDLTLLRSVEPTLDHAVDFGWFTVFAYPLLKLMKWLNGIFSNYGVAIIILTLIVKVLTFPLTYKSMKSMKEMAKLNPHLQKLREKFKDDREALNREMMSLMKTHGYNPLAGCLPILVQMPVFFALYRVLYSSVELYQAPFALWIHDLSAKDPYYVTPLVLTAVMYIQQRLTPTTAMDPTQKKMMQLMPIIFGVFMITLPSGLALYMLVNAVASIVQQLILNKKLEMPQVSSFAAKTK